MDTFCAKHAVVDVPWHVKKVIVRSDWLARPKILDGPKHDFFLGTERTAMNRFVPFLPVPQGRIGLRHALSYSVSAD